MVLNADVPVTANANTTVTGQASALAPGDLPNALDGDNATKFTDESTKQMGKVGNAAVKSSQALNVMGYISSIGGAMTGISKLWTGYKQGEAIEKQAKADVDKKEVEKKMQAVEVDKSGLEQKMQATRYLERQSTRQPFEALPETKNAARLAILAISQECVERLEHHEQCEVLVCAVADGNDLAEELRVELGKQLQFLAGFYPGRILIPSIIVFGSIQSAFDALEASLISPRIVQPPEDTIGEYPRTNRLISSRTFTVMGLASDVDCVVKQLEPHGWGNVSVPWALLVPAWHMCTFSSTSLVIIPGVRIVGPHIQGLPLHSVRSCTAFNDELEQKIDPTHIIRRQCNILTANHVAFSTCPKLGDRRASLRQCRQSFPDLINVTILTDCLVNVAVRQNGDYLDPANGEPILYSKIPVLEAQIEERAVSSLQTADS